MPATEYGKYLKKLRIDKDNTLAAMAKNMWIAPSYLSAIESGERVIPVDFTEKISEKYSLDDTAKDELRELELKTPPMRFSWTLRSRAARKNKNENFRC